MDAVAFLSQGPQCTYDQVEKPQKDLNFYIKKRN